MDYPIIVIDNGAASCRVGYAGQANPLKVFPNYVAKAKGIKKSFIGDQVESCEDIQGLSFRRPFDRGYLINWDCQKEIWDRAFSEHLRVKPAESSLLLTEAVLNLPSLRKATDEVIFEDYGFQSYYAIPAPVLSHFHQTQVEPSSLAGRSKCSLVVDAGFSFTHAVPVFDLFPLNYAIRRIDLGGKALTNYLKEVVSYRAWNMMDQTFLMEDVKERLCFCSLDPAADLAVARQAGPSNIFRCHYVLPDGVRHTRGYVKDPSAARAAVLRQEEAAHRAASLADPAAAARAGRARGLAHEGTGDGQVARNSQPGMPVAEKPAPPDARMTNPADQELVLTNERFMVPEMLFRPSDLGVKQAGLAECIVRAVSACPSELHPLLYASILLTGGSARLPFFKQRLELELRPLVPDHLEVHCHLSDSPTLTAWRGGSLFAASSPFQECAVTKAEYEEHGSRICQQRFAC